ncbi:MAG TPA: PEP/pyruvate-binding domain-containing protein [Bacteroidales bacterium]|nr:PEP/pyruvate-binding domain-containing protein [Bacteroidales bacterium]
MDKSRHLLAQKYFFKDTAFFNLMKKRIYNILLIASEYDRFILEGDGRVDEQIFHEYVSLSLRYPPQFFVVNTPQKAFETLGAENIDLIITMLSDEGVDTFELVKKLKKRYPNIPIVVLTTFSREVSLKISREDMSAIDYVFSWLGNSDILLAIIKLIEDKMNCEHDINEVGVQAILLVEDSVRFYSVYLPNMYKIIFKQSKTFMTEGLNEHQQMMRMRGRPKILLATNYEEAIGMYEKYKNNLLGIITDMSYNRSGTLDKYAGVKLVKKVKADDEYMPILLQSSDIGNQKTAKELRVGFVHKHSKVLSLELRNFIFDYLAFGDFVFKNPDNGQEINRAADLKALQQKVFEIPDRSLAYHIYRNHFSKWLRARALFPLADLFREVRPEDFSDLDDVRRFIFDAIALYRLNKSRGIIAKFNRDSFDEYLNFTRIGDGSIGGKARGLAFLDNLIKQNPVFEKYKDVQTTIPRTVVLCTDIFDEFMEENRLHKIALSDIPDEEILRHFINSRLPFRIHEDLYTLISVIHTPIAIRSSSLLEDSYCQPFAGIYSTYMIPNISGDERLMIEMLTTAIKSVYASAFFKESKSYMAATMNVIDEEKMAIVLQEVCGQRYDNVFYPTISGVARSINFYPIPPETPLDGIANIAFGLGKYIVDGGLTLRFSPRYPKKVLQLSTPELAMRETQRIFYALDLRPESYYPSTDDSVNLLKTKVQNAENHAALRYVASTLDTQSHQVRDGMIDEGQRLITFSNVLNHGIFPLAEIINEALVMGQRAMNKHVEIEFAVNLDCGKGKPKIFNLLQIRPIVDNRETIEANLENVDASKTLLLSLNALGNGTIKDVFDVVYVRPEGFNAANNQMLMELISKINDKLVKEKRNYVLVGPGRWGSSDPWLGIPVKWPNISNARVIVESGLENYRIDPSQGTHFFHNLTSFRVGYFTINPYLHDGHYDVAFLNSAPAEYEDNSLRHVRFARPLLIQIDGKKKIGVVHKPNSAS